MIARRRVTGLIGEQPYTVSFCQLLLISLISLGAAWGAGAPRPGHEIKLQWQPIAPGDLALKDNPDDPGEDAMTLYHEVYVDEPAHAILEYIRIKIFTDEGRKNADVELTYVPGSSEIRDLRARTIQPDGRIIDLNEKPLDQVIVKGRRYKVFEKKLTLPNVQAGSIVEYMYRRQHNPEYTNDYEWPVQGDLYTRQGVFSLRPLTLLNLNWRKHRLPAAITPGKQPDGSYRLEVKNLPGVAKEEFMPPDKAVRGRLSFFYRSVLVGGGEPAEQFWDRMGGVWAGGLEDFLIKSKLVARAAAASVRTDESTDAKLRKLYDRAQQIRNLDYENEQEASGKKQKKWVPNETVDDVIQHGYGTSRQINDAFIGLVRAAGYKATQVLVTSRDNDFFVPQLVDLSQLDEDVVAVRSGDQELYFDPGNPHFPYGLLPWYVAGTRGLRLALKGGEIVTTAEPRSSDGIVARHAKVRLDKDGSLSGDVQVEFRGQRACSIREGERENDALGRNKDVSERIKRWLPEDATFEIGGTTGWDSSSAPILATGTLRLPGFATISGNRASVPLTFFVAPETKAFQSANRVNDVYFAYPYEELDDIYFAMPEGWHVEALPPEQRSETPSLKFDVRATVDGAAIHVNRRVAVEQFLFPVKEYPSVRAFFSGARAGDEQQVLISRQPQ